MFVGVCGCVFGFVCLCVCVRASVFACVVCVCLCIIHGNSFVFVLFSLMMGS